MTEEILLGTSKIAQNTMSLVTLLFRLILVSTPVIAADLDYDHRYITLVSMAAAMFILIKCLIMIKKLGSPI